jgi:uncharacterized protein (TIGR03083 family)
MDEMNAHFGADEEVAALLALDALEPDEQAAAELRVGTLPLEIGRATLPLAESVSAEPPADLRTRVLTAALTRRPVGGTVSPPNLVTPAEAFTRTIGDFHALLTSLRDEEWDVVAHETHGRVRDLVAHLLGVERLNTRWLDPDDDVPYLPDHVASTAPVVASTADLPPAQLVRTWHDAALAMLARARRRDSADLVTFHDLVLTVDGLLTTRTFELWAHGMDIALATGRPLPTLDDERMLLMSSRLMAALPEALAYRGVSVDGRSVRFVLTGRAGACYDVPLGRPPRTGRLGWAAPQVTIIADVVELCQVAAARRDPDHLDVTFEGDADLGALVMTHVNAFARD